MPSLKIAAPIFLEIFQPRSEGLSSYRLGRARRDSLAPGGKMRDPRNEVGDIFD